ncbi:MAG: GTPase [Planctomycetaceae bacterium]
MRTAPTVTVLTPRGRGAIAVVSARIAPSVFDVDPPPFRAANGRPLTAQPINRVCFGRWGDHPGEDVVVCRVAADVTEISCHGGTAAVARIVRDLERRGCTLANWQDQAASEQSPLTAECQSVLVQAPTLRTAAILLEQSQGLLEHSLAALWEVPLEELRRRLEELLRWSAFGRHLMWPWQIVLTGMPNVGKSSLINRLLGYSRSIVYHQPGTTRDVVSATTVLDGWPVELSDTAGLRDAAGEVEAAGVAIARNQAVAADLPIVVLDQSRPLQEDERRLIDSLHNALCVAHKSDLPCGWSNDRLPDAIRVSSLTGQGIDDLMAAIVARLVPEAPGAGAAIPVTERQIACLTAASAAATAGDIVVARDCIARCIAG